MNKVHGIFPYNDPQFLEGRQPEGAEEFAKAKAEELGIKLGDFMMPVRMAVTGSRVSPPLIGSISVLGKDRALARIDRTLATL